MDLVAATGFRARLIGLAFRRLAPSHGLVFERCRSIHTFGMRFPIDVVFLDAAGDVVRAEAAVPARRLRFCRAARAVVEVPSSHM